LIYLDTHVVIWLYSGDRTLFSKRALETIEKQSLVISPVVMLEIHFMNEIGRVNPKADDIVSHLADTCGLAICRKRFEEICLKAMTLGFTRDPFDLLITAQAAIGKHPLVTKDRRIHSHYDDAVW
jgi:PIN domain nuclease of toxin-antitoxin system